MIKKFAFILCFGLLYTFNIKSESKFIQNQKNIQRVFGACAGGTTATCIAGALGTAYAWHTGMHEHVGKLLIGTAITGSIALGSHMYALILRNKLIADCTRKKMAIEYFWAFNRGLSIMSASASTCAFWRYVQRKS